MSLTYRGLIEDARSRDGGERGLYESMACLLENILEMHLRHPTACHEYGLDGPLDIDAPLTPDLLEMIQQQTETAVVLIPTELIVGRTTLPPPVQEDGEVASPYRTVPDKAVLTILMTFLREFVVDLSLDQ